MDDPVDHGLNGLGLVRVMDPETGERRLIDASVLAGTPSVESRLQLLRASGAAGLAVSTSDDPFLALHRHFQRVSHRR